MEGEPHEVKNTFVRALHARADVWVDDSLARDTAKAAYETLLSSNRLVLVMDIDHTMLHCVIPSQRKVLLPPYITPLSVRGTMHLVKLRPGIQRFLNEMDKLFELHIYTHGSRAYAAEVGAVLDPTGTLFGKRIVSRDDCDHGARKELPRIFPYRHNHVVVVDDSSSVWRSNAKQNGSEGGTPAPVVKVPQYLFFPQTGTSFPPNDTETTDRHTLQKVAAYLTKLHAAFFAETTRRAKKRERGDGEGEGEGGAVPVEIAHLLRNKRQRTEKEKVKKIDPSNDAKNTEGLARFLSERAGEGEEDEEEVEEEGEASAEEREMEGALGEGEEEEDA